MEVAVRLWQRFANAAGGFLEETAFRTSLAWAVLRGKSPKPLQKRWWNRAAETPALLDVYSWVDERLIFSVLIWPPLETPAHDAGRVFHERVREVKSVICKGAAEMAWTTRLEIDFGLKWDAERQVWTGSDGYAYDGKRLYEYSRGEAGGREL